MKIKTSKLTGAALDWAVAKCEGIQDSEFVRTHMDAWPYSTDWAQGGPIIDREGIEFRASGTQASIVDGRTYYGPTHLIAAMRCFVASKLGNEVEIPEELSS